MQISSTTSGVHGVGGPPPPPAKMKETMQAAAKTLGLSDDELKSKLQSGSSLAEVAEEHGVSKEDLIKSLAESIKTSSAGNVDATAMATKMVDRKGHGGPPPGGPGGPPPGGPRPADKAESNTSTLADTLGVDASDLLEQLENGDLTKLLQSRYTQASAATTGGLQVDHYA